MGILFDSLSKLSQKSERKKVPVQLVEPSYGRVVKLQVTETKYDFAKLYMSQLISYADMLKEINSEFPNYGLQSYTIFKKTMTMELTFFDPDSAEKCRNFWANRLNQD